MNQFRKSTEEKLAIKAAKKAFKRGDSPPMERIDRPVAIVHNNSRPLLSGKVEGEFELGDDYSVAAGFKYLARYKDDHYKVVEAPYKGTVKSLRNDLNKPPFIKGSEYIVAILNCNQIKRNLI